MRWVLTLREKPNFDSKKLEGTAAEVADICKRVYGWPNALFLHGDSWALMLRDASGSSKTLLEHQLNINLTHAELAEYCTLTFGEVAERLADHPKKLRSRG